MGGSTRMVDPSEEAHDRTRRRWMNLALFVILGVSAALSWLVGVQGWDWLTIGLNILAGIPFGVLARILELRFKMSNEERTTALRQLPSRRKASWLAYSILVSVAFALNPGLGTWTLLGAWGCDFVTYYHDRPERMRHLYAIMKTLDELREFPAPWAWVLPALAANFVRMLWT